MSPGKAAFLGALLGVTIALGIPLAIAALEIRGELRAKARKLRVARDTDVPPAGA